MLVDLAIEINREWVLSYYVHGYVHQCRVGVCYRYEWL